MIEGSELFAIIPLDADHKYAEAQAFGADQVRPHSLVSVNGFISTVANETRRGNDHRQASYWCISRLGASGVGRRNLVRRHIAVTSLYELIERDSLRAVVNLVPQQHRNQHSHEVPAALAAVWTQLVTRC